MDRKIRMYRKIGKTLKFISIVTLLLAAPCYFGMPHAFGFSRDVAGSISVIGAVLGVSIGVIALFIADDVDDKISELKKQQPY